MESKTSLYQIKVQDQGSETLAMMVALDKAVAKFDRWAKAQGIEATTEKFETPKAVNHGSYWIVSVKITWKAA